MGWLLVTGSSSGDIVLFDCFKKTSVARILRADELGVNTIQVCVCVCMFLFLFPGLMCLLLSIKKF